MKIRDIILTDGTKFTLQQHVDCKGKDVCVYVSEDGKSRLPLKRIDRARIGGEHSSWPVKYSARSFYKNNLGYTENELQLLKDIPKDRNLALLHIKNKKKGIQMAAEKALKDE